MRIFNPCFVICYNVQSVWVVVCKKRGFSLNGISVRRHLQCRRAITLLPPCPHYKCYKNKLDGITNVALSIVGKELLKGVKRRL
jgi:hypothetical protein